MKYATILVSLLTVIGLSACDKPAVVNTPANPVAVPVPVPMAVPGPPGPQGAPGQDGAPGNTGTTGDTGKPGDNTVIVIPPPTPAAPATPTNQ